MKKFKVYIFVIILFIINGCNREILSTDPKFIDKAEIVILLDSKIDSENKTVFYIPSKVVRGVVPKEILDSRGHLIWNDIFEKDVIYPKQYVIFISDRKKQKNINKGYSYIMYAVINGKIKLLNKELVELRTLK